MWENVHYSRILRKNWARSRSYFFYSRTNNLDKMFQNNLWIKEDKISCWTRDLFLHVRTVYLEGKSTIRQTWLFSPQDRQWCLRLLSPCTHSQASLQFDQCGTLLGLTDVSTAKNYTINNTSKARNDNHSSLLNVQNTVKLEFYHIMRPFHYVEPCTRRPQSRCRVPNYYDNNNSITQGTLITHCSLINLWIMLLSMSGSTTQSISFKVTWTVALFPSWNLLLNASMLLVL